MRVPARGARVVVPLFVRVELLRVVRAGALFFGGVLFFGAGVGFGLASAPICGKLALSRAGEGNIKSKAINSIANMAILRQLGEMLFVISIFT